MANSSREPFNYTLAFNSATNYDRADSSITSEHEENAMEIEEFVYRYIGPVFIIAGIFGNIVAFITLCRPPLNNFSSSVYLAAYSFSAVLVLVFCLGLDWCLHMTGTNHFRNYSDSACRLWQFFDKMVKCSGVWFLIGGAVDRFIGLWLPYKAQDMCTVFIAKLSVSLTLVGITSLNVHALWMHDLNNLYHPPCYLDSTFKFKFIWQWTSTILCYLLPQSCLFLLGNLLVVRLCLKHRGRQIPETASIEMDLTYTVMIFSIIYGTFGLPGSITNVVVSIDQMLMADYKFRMFFYFTNYLMWVCYSCLALVLTFRSKAFRESIIGMVFRCISLIRHGGSTVEMKIMTEEYDQIPSTSTTL